MYRKSTVTVIILFSLLIAVIVNVTPVVAITWSTETNRLTDYPFFDGFPSITQLEDGTIMIVWSENAMGNLSLFYSLSHDFGSTWPYDGNLTAVYASGDDSSPSVVQLDNDTIFVAWASNRPPPPSPPEPDFSMTASPQNLTIQQGSSKNSTITVTSLNNFNEPVSLMVPHPPSGVNTTLNPTEVTPPPNGNATSILAVSVEPTATLGNYTFAVIGESGKMHGVNIYLEITGSTEEAGGVNHKLSPPFVEEADVEGAIEDYDIYYKVSHDYITSWSNDTILANNEVDDTNPSVFQAANGTIYIFWSSDRNSNNDIFYKASSDFGSSWSNEMQITNDTEDDNGPSVTQTQDGKIWVTWCSNRSGNYEIMCKTYDGSSWSPDMTLTNSTNSDTSPSILQTVDGVIWIFWASDPLSPTSTGDIYYKSSSNNGTTWSESIQFTTDAAEDTWPCATEMGDTRICVVWTSNRGDLDGNWDIYYRTSLGRLYINIIPAADAEYWAYDPTTGDWDGPYSPGWLEPNPYATQISENVWEYKIKVPKVKEGKIPIVHAGTGLVTPTGDPIPPYTRIEPIAGEIHVPGHPESGPVLTYNLYVNEGGTMTTEYQRAGPQVDVWRELVIKSPDDQLIAIKTGVIDFLPDLIRPADIEDLGAQTPPYTVTDAPSFHIAHVGINLRLPVLDDVNFRHALLHGYAQDDIIASIYEYTVTPIRSLVPPVQSGWVNPAIPTHPFNHGDMGDAPGTQSVFGILYAAGYTYHGTGYGDLGAYWLTPGDDPIPGYVMWTPTYETAPTSAEHGARIMDEWHRCGLNTLTHTPADFNWYTGKVFDEQDFDMYMMPWDLGKLLRGRGRFPDHLYDMCHSSQNVPGAYNAPGIHDPVLDPMLETIKYGLDHDEKVDAAFDAQAWLYTPDNPWAFPYLQLYSRVYFNSFRPELGGIVNSMGYGSDNDWTLYNIHWETPDGLRPETGDNMVIYCNGEVPASLNPLQASTVYEWNIISQTMSGLIVVNPYTHQDLPWVATDWTIEGPWTGTAPNGVPIVDGMKVTYNLRKDVYWHDGNPFTAHDAVFSLEFVRDNAIPRYTAAWTPIVDVHANDDYSFTVYADETGQFYLYDWAGMAPLLPPQVWSHMDGKLLPDILGYEVWKNTTDTGPWSTPTCLFGIGPMVFQGYDETGMYADLYRFEGWFKTTDELGEMTVTMFHKVGDCAPPDYDHRTDPAAYDGLINDDDQSVMSLSFGYWYGEPEFAPHADINGDDSVDMSDTSMLSFYFGWRRDFGPST